MKTAFLSFAVFSFFSLHAQYYYNDIIGTQETNHQMQTYLANKVKMVSATGYTAQGSKATDFAEIQEIKENGRTLRISSNAEMNSTILYKHFDEQARLISITDSSSGAGSITTYMYDMAGRITKIENKVKDTSSEIDQTETHIWIWSNDGKPVTMWRIINGSDSLEIRFIPDEKGNPGEERSFRRGYETDYLYYYFDDKTRITDIVRYNKKVKRLLPDVIISYDDSDRAIQKIISAPADNYGRVTWIGYNIWRYVFNEKGLKTKEALYNNDRELTGKIEYSYTFGQ